MRLFDLHCDTLYRIHTEKLSANSQKLSVTPQKAKCFEKYRQLMAVWIPDNIRGEAAESFFESCADIYNKYYEPLNDSTVEFMLSVENGSVIMGDIRKIPKLKVAGVKSVTLVYNEDNELGSGCMSGSKFGLTATGREAVKAFEKSGITIDLSHSSVRTFYDVAEISEKPIIATHSNSYSLCPHNRNLTDEQFNVIKEKGGIVGINVYPPFLSSNPDNASVCDVIKHIEHFLSLGGENVVSIGADLDGCDALSALDSVEKFSFLYETLLKSGFTEQVVQKIFYYNAYNFFA